MRVDRERLRLLDRERLADATLVAATSAGGGTSMVVGGTPMATIGSSCATGTSCDCSFAPGGEPSTLATSAGGTGTEKDMLVGSATAIVPGWALGAGQTDGFA